MLKENNPSSELNIFQKGEFMKEEKKDTTFSSQFPYANKTDLGSKYRYHERKCEFDTPKISSRLRTFQKNLTGYTPIPTLQREAKLITQPISFPTEFNNNGFNLPNLPKNLPTKTETFPALQFSFLKKPNTEQITPSFPTNQHRFEVIQSLRSHVEKPKSELSEYEAKIGQRINRKVALTFLPLFCIVYLVALCLDLILGSLLYSNSFFHTIFALSCNFHRIIRSLAIVLPLLSYKRIFYGTEFHSSDYQFPYFVKIALMGAVYFISSLVSYFSFFHKMIVYLSPTSDYGFYFNFKPVFLFGFAVLFALYKIFLFVARRESILIYQWYPASFRFISINPSIYLMSCYLVFFVLFHKLYLGMLFFVPRIFFQYSNFIIFSVDMVSLRSLTFSDVFFIILVFLYSHLLGNLWSFDYFLILKEMTCNPRIVELMPRGIINAIPGLESSHLHLRMLAYIDVINAFGRSEIQRSHLWEDIDSRPSAWDSIKNSCSKVLRDWISLLAKTRSQLIAFEKDIISNQDDSIWLGIKGVPEIAMLFDALYRSSLFYSEYEQVLLALELTRLIILFSYEEDRYGIVQSDLVDIIKLYIDIIFEIESFNEMVPARPNKWADLLLDATVRSSGSYYGTTDPMGSVLVESVNTVHEMYRVFDKDLMELDLPVRYKNKISAILASESTPEAGQ